MCGLFGRAARAGERWGRGGEGSQPGRRRRVRLNGLQGEGRALCPSNPPGSAGDLFLLRTRETRGRCGLGWREGLAGHLGRLPLLSGVLEQGEKMVAVILTVTFGTCLQGVIPSCPLYPPFSLLRSRSGAPLISVALGYWIDGFENHKDEIDRKKDCGHFAD